MLTEQQYKEIGSRLFGTCNNVYLLSKQMFQHEWTEDDWVKLEKLADTFRCSECNEWKDISEKEPNMIDMCCSCTNEMNEDIEE